MIVRADTTLPFAETLAVTVTQIFKAADGSSGDLMDPMHLVEITGSTSPARSATVVGNVMAEFAEQLRPLVLLHLFLEDGFRL